MFTKEEKKDFRVKAFVKELKIKQAETHLEALRQWRKETFLNWYEAGQARLQLWNKLVEVDTAITVTRYELEILQEKPKCQNSTNSQPNLQSSTTP